MKTYDELSIPSEAGIVRAPENEPYSPDALTDENAPDVHVGINLVYLVPGETGGTETYARELIPALVEAAPEGMTFTTFLSREAASARGEPWKELVPSVTVSVSARRRTELVAGEQVALPRLAGQRRVDVLHSLATTAPARGAFRRVTTIQDLIYKLYPEAHFGGRALGLRMLVPVVARTSHRLIATSEQTCRDLIEQLHVDPARIDLVPLGFGASRRAEPLAEREVRARFRLGDGRVALAVSAKRPHKNLGRLLEALALLDADRRPVLVLPGYPTPHEEELRRKVRDLRLEERVRFLGWITPEELEGLYAAATCVVVPSLYEGFGLPVLEAMSRGVPVACSGRGALAEVAGNAALLFDPERPDEIAHAIERLLLEPATAARLRELGAERVTHFTWERTARGTLESYERALRETRS